MSNNKGVYQFFVRYLKTHPSTTLLGITNAYLIEKGATSLTDIAEVQDAIQAVINLLKEKGLLEDGYGYYKFHQILDPIPKRLVGFIETNPLMEFMNENPDSVGPVEYRNTDVKDLAQRIQGDRGTCVGQACANVKDLTSIPFDRPDSTDKESYKRDIKDPDGLLHDNLYYTSASAECAYQISRRLGNITAPSGSYTYLGMKALTGGACFEDEWPTSKTPYMTLPNPRPDMKDAATISMANHKIDGYATLYPLTFENCKAAISKYHVVAGSFDIYENYGSMMGGDGTFPEPKGEVIGGHALCLYGYDVDYLYCIHTWGDWCGRFGRISKHYFDTCCNDIFCPLDSFEAARTDKEYAEITCISNTRTNFYLLNGEEKNYIGTYAGEKKSYVGVVEAPVTLKLKKGVPVVFYAEATEFYNLNLTTKYTPYSDGLFVVTFETPINTTGLITRFFNWFVKIFGV